MKLTPSMLRLYAVTDRSWSADEADFWRRVSEAMEGGAQVVQLREKHLSHEAMLRAAERFVALCRKCGAVSIINDDVEAAVASGADGVHVGQEDLEAGRARALLGPDKLIGVSAHNVEEALAAQAAGADYLGVGAAFVTIRAITQAVDIPVVAIGGIGPENILDLAGCGLDGVAVVSALFAREDTAQAARQMRALAEQIAR